MCCSSFCRDVCRKGAKRGGTRAIVGGVAVLPYVPSIACACEFWGRVQRVGAGVGLRLVVCVAVMNFLATYRGRVPCGPKRRSPRVVVGTLLRAKRTRGSICLRLNRNCDVRRLGRTALFLCVGNGVTRAPGTISPRRVCKRLRKRLSGSVCRSLLGDVHFGGCHLADALRPNSGVHLRTATRGKGCRTDTRIAIPRPVRDLRISAYLTCLHRCDKRALCHRCGVALRSHPGRGGCCQLSV